ncbi:TonB-dependent siderophore receptor [Gallaecimonas kandeliae]|uniref:TonB-dependent receptor n=1 Tax=Gallaecimonas kandeliae TaxID=3029055 RepID=UPI002648284A|nr:TonB-dependent siderophore receptor [Gallaecimonas kandeliae]WKE64121.1 TonB-dependent siderophore receptor [Gallaecimonas kandeliae]
MAASSKTPLPAQSLLTIALGMAVTAPALADNSNPKKSAVERIEVVGQHQGYKIDQVQSSKFTDSLGDTAKSVTVIGSDLIQDMGAMSFSDTLRATPGITLGSGEGGNPYGDRPFIRGYDAQSSTFADGLRDIGSQSREVFNIEQVEVFKGPNSAYAGRGAVGGSINIVTKTPGARDFNHLSLTAGTDNLKRATLDTNKVVGNEAAVRLNLMSHDADMPGRSGVDGDRWGIAPSLALGLTTQTRAKLAYYHFESHDMPDYGIPYDQATGQPAAVDRDNFYGLLNRDFRRNTVDSGLIKIEHDLGPDLLLTSTSRYGRSSNDYVVTNPDDSKGNVASGTVFRGVKSRYSVTDSLATGLDLSGSYHLGGLANRFAVGLELSKEETDADSYRVTTGVILPSGASSTHCQDAGMLEGYFCAPLSNPNPSDPWVGSIERKGTPTHTRTTSRSLYGFNSTDLSEQWLLSLGLRWDEYDTESTPYGGETLGNSDGFLNYQLGLVYKPAGNGSVYLSYGTSSNPPGTSNGDGADRLSTSNDDLAPEDTKSLELGSKWDLFGDALSATVAVFRTEKNNARVAVEAGRGAPQENVGKQKVDGFELGLSGMLTANWQLFGGYSYLDATLEGNGINSQYDGNAFPNTAKHSLSLFTNYGLTDSLKVGGGAYYMSKVYGNTANTLSVPAYWRFDAMASMEVNSWMTLRLNVQNLTDKRYFDKAYAAHFATVAPGRLVTLTADLRF